MLSNHQQKTTTIINTTANQINRKEQLHDS